MGFGRLDDVISRRIPHLVGDRDRHGNLRWYVRIRGARKRRLRADPDAPEFFAEYLRLLDEARAEAAGGKDAKHEAGTVGWLVAAYLRSAAFGDLSIGTRSRREKLFAAFVAEHGHRRADRLPRRAMRAIMDEWKARHGPFGADNHLKAIRGLYAWAVARGHVDRDATREVGYFSPVTSGFHTWTPSEIRKFMGHWPLGTAPRLAMTVMLCTGARRGDAWQIGPSSVYRRQGGEERIRFKPEKTGKTSNIAVDIPLLPMLRDALAAGPEHPDAWVVGQRGRPFGSREAFGVTFKEWCVAAGLPHCSAHGLRKGGATILAESGVTSSQLMAIYGWTRLEQAERYTRTADRARLGDALSGGFGIEEDDE